MVPMAVQQSMSIYSQRKAETVNRLVGTMREATNLCNGYAVLVYRTLLCSACAACVSDYTGENYLPLNMSVSALVFIKNV